MISTRLISLIPSPKSVDRSCAHEAPRQPAAPAQGTAPESCARPHIHCHLALAELQVNPRFEGFLLHLLASGLRQRTARRRPQRRARHCKWCTTGGARTSACADPERPAVSVCRASTGSREPRGPGASGCRAHHLASSRPGRGTRLEPDVGRVACRGRHWTRPTPRARATAPTPAMAAGTATKALHAALRESRAGEDGRATKHGHGGR